MTNAADEDFAMHRRLMLTVALKIGDRDEKDENFTAAAASEADGADGEKISETTAIGEAGEAVKKEEEINRTMPKCLKKALLSASSRVFSSHDSNHFMKTSNC